MNQARRFLVRAGGRSDTNVCLSNWPASQPLSEQLVTHEKDMIEAALAKPAASVLTVWGGRQARSSALDAGIKDPITEDQQASIHTPLV